jgi:hypothetical protein
VDEIRKREKDLQSDIERHEAAIIAANEGIEKANDELRRLADEEIKLKKDTQGVFGSVFRNYQQEEQPAVKPKKWMPAPPSVGR